MPTQREQPCLNARFLVDLGVRGADPQAAQAGFCEVVFPPFVVAPPRTDAPASEVTPPAVQAPLVLRRGVTGQMDLAGWWDKACKGKPPRRTVTVALLAEDGSTVVMRWRFLGARPLALHYAPLVALDGSVLIESIEIAFDSVEIS